MFFRTSTPTSSEQLHALMTGLSINAGQGSVDDNTAQRTVVYENSPEVLIVASLQEKSPIGQYHLLPELPLSPEQKALIEEKVKPKIRFDGDHILVTDCEHVEADNKIYLQAVRVKYSTLSALSSKIITADTPLFKTGVMTPVMTTDKKIVFIQRNDAYRLFSAPSGFLQPLKDTNELTFTHETYKADLVRGTALKELHEEIFGEAGQLAGLALSPKLGISMRYFSNGSLPTMEFIQPVKTQYTAEALITLLNNNTSEDANEHLKNYWIFDYSTRETFELSLKEVGSAEKPGFFLYLPMLETIFPHLKERIRENLNDAEKSNTHSMTKR